MLSAHGFYSCTSTTQPESIQCTARQNKKIKENVQQTLTGPNNITSGRKSTTNWPLVLSMPMTRASRTWIASNIERNRKMHEARRWILTHTSYCRLSCASCLAVVAGTYFPETILLSEKTPKTAKVETEHENENEVTNFIYIYAI